jgi:outer membrane protein assembly factor BamB
MVAGVLALLIAILIIFKPFGNDKGEIAGGEEILLSPSGNVETVEAEAGAGEGVVEESTSGSEAGEPGSPPVLEDIPSGVEVVLSEGWKKKFDAAVTSSPVICGDNVTFGCRDGNLYCFSLDGEINWKYEAGTGVGATPACSGDRVIGADYEGNVFCLDMAGGKQIWNYRSGAKIVSSPVIVSRNKVVLVGTMDGRIISLDFESGERNWSQKIGEQVWATPSVGKEYILAATTDGSLVRMNHAGKIVWRVAPGGSLHSSPLCLENDDLVVIGTGDRYLIGYSLSKGMLMWRYGAGSEVRSAPVASGGRIFAGTEDGILVALDKNGVLLWKKDLGGAIRSKPLIMGEMIAVTGYNSKLYMLSMSDGSVAAEYSADAPIYSSPAYHDGRVFFGSNGGFLHAPVVTMTGG